MDDLGLSLTLATVSSSHHHHAANHPWADIFSPPPATTRSLAPTGIDVNCAPPVAAETADDDAGASSSPNSTVSSVSAGKRGLPMAESESDRAAACSDDDDAAAGEGSRKKLRLSKDQSAILEDSFKEHSTLNPKQKMALAKQLNLRARQVEVWFQNRRARTKLKQTEVDCEFLKRCCENLTEENRRLQKEVQELRALKLSPQFYMHMTPPTTLTLCPSCERVSAPTTTTASSSHISVDRNRVGNGNGNIHQLSFFQQQRTAALPTPPPLQQQRQVALGNPVLPWAPMPLRAGTAFLDAQLQRT